ncbi:NAD(P)-dependent oxidoreductase [Bradyrhizobium sp. NP1]|uniref:NAD-dependent epimerase/dehydratase family protein n=1 Tax=Bradyrhizobium sp. NP1 TaxID=3049772 RepID=UPI0025A51F48|nr:NAD(P)-dependent oxidoreductase [Bradyrhizobium sp. NP1]WJR81416.1 NAD(P)-dependent oxidoreductase [Bradyrhizobium sp. NP1]
MIDRPTILVAGAGGFIGARLAETLCRAGVAHVKAGVLSSTSRARIAALPIEIVDCDVMDQGSLDTAMSGVDVVIHCARNRTDPGATVRSTELVLDRARARGVRKLIYMSSVAVYGNARGIVTEDTSPVPPVSLYGRSKYAAEQACRAAAGQRLAVAVLRPSLVYGPYGEEWTARYIASILAGELKQLGQAGNGKANLVHVDDVVRFANQLAVAELPNSYSVFNVNGPEIPTFNAYFEKLNRALGCGSLPDSRDGFAPGAAIKRPIRALGKYIQGNHQGALRAANKIPVLNGLLKQVEARLRSTPAEAVGLYDVDVVFSALHAKQFGFEARISLDEGIASCVDWATQAGLISRDRDFPFASR